MKVALISDVHGNLEALTAVLEDIHKESRAEEILFLGDAVGYGANPNEVLRLIKAECRVKIMGNHDYSALGLLDASDFNTYARSAIAFTASVLDSESVGVLSSFQLKHVDSEVLLVHATPEQPEAWNYCLSLKEADRQFRHFEDRLCFLGHSHKPIVYARNFAGEAYNIGGREIDLEKEYRYIINTGSVGQPRDGDPRACYVMFDTDAGQISYRRVEYDLAAAQAKMAAVNLPEFLIERLAGGK